jgi:crotonobetainyl-CoA:carnitine CoA-transferase CaiB-like acyl-CoA transferase
MVDESLLLPLDGLNVIEISGLECVAYAGLLLLQLGAQVMKVEPAGGDALRRRPPFAPGVEESDDSASVPFGFLNAGKKLTRYDVHDVGCVTRVLGEIQTADILLVDHEALRELSLELPPRSARQLRVFVGLFGGSPEQSIPSSALTRLHASTSGYIIPADADVRMRPAWPGPYIFECMHGVGIAIATLAEREREEGGDVDYSLQGYGLWLDKLLFSRTSTSGIELHRNTAPYPYGGNLACADGFAALLVLEERQWRGLCAMIEKPEWLTDERFKSGVLRNRNREPIGEALADWCSRHSVDEVLEAARRADVPAGRCRSPLAVLNSEIAADRDFFLEQDTCIGKVRVPGLPFGPNFRGRVAGSNGSKV